MDRPRLKEVIEKWKQAPAYEGVRAATLDDFIGLDDLDWMNLEIIWDAMEAQELLFFEYSGRDRVIAPFVLGVSSEGNALVRGYMVEGSSKSGKGPGWRVFQMREMSMVDLFGEWFKTEDFDFKRDYPWVYKVFRTL